MQPPAWSWRMAALNKSCQGQSWDAPVEVTRPVGPRGWRVPTVVTPGPGFSKAPECSVCVSFPRLPSELGRARGCSRPREVTSHLGATASCLRCRGPPLGAGRRRLARTDAAARGEAAPMRVLSRGEKVLRAPLGAQPKASPARLPFLPRLPFNRVGRCGRSCSFRSLSREPSSSSTPLYGFSEQVIRAAAYLSCSVATLVHSHLGSSRSPGSRGASPGIWTKLASQRGDSRTGAVGTEVSY